MMGSKGIVFSGEKDMLNYSILGEGTKTIFVLHGIFGSFRNWRSFALRLHRQQQNFRIVLIDLRCHGDSSGQQAPHTLAACAQDILALARSIGHPDVVIGHSFGGKVALCYGRIAHPCLLYTSPSPRDRTRSRMPSSA